MNAFFHFFKSLWTTNKKIFSLFFVLFYVTPLSLYSVEMMMWHRYIGADSTGVGAFVSYLYSPDSGYTQFSLPSGVNDNNNFLIQNSNEIVCSGSIAQGSYTITVRVSNGSINYQQNIDFRVVAGSYHPKISAGLQHLVILTSGGEIYACGYAGDYQLGLGHTSGGGSLQRVNGSGSTLENEAISDIEAGEQSTYFLTREGAIFAAGTDTIGKFGVNGATTYTTPTELTALSSQKIVQVSSLSEHTACLTYDGTLLMFGNNLYGQLGLNNATNYTTATSVQAATNTIDSVFIISARVGKHHSSLLGSNSTIYTAGRNHQNQLSRSGEEDQFYTTTLSSCSGLWSGNHQLYALAGSGNDLYSAGWNFEGALGIGSGPAYDQGYNFTAADISSVNILQIASHTQASYLLSDSGGVYVFGENTYDVLTDTSNTLDNPTPTILSSSLYGNKTASQVTMGQYFVAILTEEGSIYTCGRNNRGQLGLNFGNTRMDTPSIINVYSEGSNFSVGANERFSTDQTPTLAETSAVTANFSITWATYSLEIDTIAL